MQGILLLCLLGHVLALTRPCVQKPHEALWPAKFSWQMYIEQNLPMIGENVSEIGISLSHSYVTAQHGYILPVHNQTGNSSWAEWVVSSSQHLHFELHVLNGEFVVCSTSQFDYDHVPTLFSLPEVNGCGRGIDFIQARWSTVLLKLAQYVVSKCGAVVIMLHIDTFYLTVKEEETVFALTNLMLGSSVYTKTPAHRFPSVNEVMATGASFVLVGAAAQHAKMFVFNGTNDTYSISANEFHDAAKSTTSCSKLMQTLGAPVAVSEDPFVFTPIPDVAPLYNGTVAVGVLDYADAKLVYDCGLLLKTRVVNRERIDAATWVFAKSGVLPQMSCKEQFLHVKMTSSGEWTVSDPVDTLDVLCKKDTVMTEVPYTDNSISCFPSSRQELKEAIDYMRNNSKTEVTFAIHVQQQNTQAPGCVLTEGIERVVVVPPIITALSTCPNVLLDSVDISGEASACLVDAENSSGQSVTERIIDGFENLSTKSTPVIIIIASVCIVLLAGVFACVIRYRRLRYINMEKLGDSSETHRAIRGVYNDDEDDTPLNI